MIDEMKRQGREFRDVGIAGCSPAEVLLKDIYNKVQFEPPR